MQKHFNKKLKKKEKEKGRRKSFTMKQHYHLSELEKFLNFLCEKKNVLNEKQMKSTFMQNDLVDD